MTGVISSRGDFNLSVPLERVLVTFSGYRQEYIDQCPQCLVWNVIGADLERNFQNC